MTKKLFILAALIAFSFNAFTQVSVPQKPKQERLVNDFAKVFTNQQVSELEADLVNFSNQTSTQIVLVTVSSLDGYDPSMFAYQIGQEWGVGDKDKDNGIVILIKPKTSTSKGQAYIAVGYGLEAVIPDAIAKRIVENDMIPQFRNGSYYNGILAAVGTLKSLSLKEFTASDYVAKNKKKEKTSGLIVIFVLLIFFIMSFAGSYRRTKAANLGKDLPFWLLMGMMMSSGSSRGSSGGYSGFSSGGGSFGGFGGGGFGGGGAGGSW